MSGHGSGGQAARTAALRLVGLSYVAALVAGALTLAFAPIADPLARTFAADAAATVVIFGYSDAWNNSSFYDAYWSVIPIAIVLYWMTLNLAGIGIQFAINKMMPPDVRDVPVPSTVGSPKKAKKSGSQELVGSEK